MAQVIIRRSSVDLIGLPKSLRDDHTRFLGRWVANQSIPLLLGKQEVKRSDAELQQYVPMPH